MTEDACPATATHTPAPTSYVGWDNWAEAMSATHKQTRCKTCGLLTIWVAKVAGAQALDPADYETGCITIRARGTFI